MSHTITADFSGGANPAIDKAAWQYDYGASLAIKGLDLPATVEVHFSTAEYGGTAETRVGTTADGITTVAIPDRLLEMPGRQDYRIYAYIYLTDADSGHTEYKICMRVRARPKPGEEHPDTDEDHPLSDAVQAVSAAADRAESAAGAAADSAETARTAAESASEDAETARTAAESASEDAVAAKEAAEQTAEDAKQVAADREAVEQARDHVDKVVADFDQYAEDTETAAIAEILSAADAAKEAGVNAIEDAETKSLEAVQQAKSAGVKAVDDTKTAGVKAVKDAQITAETAITKAQATGVSAIEEAVETGKQNFVTDTTLNIEGRAADAKAVGKQIGVLKDDLRQLSDEITKIPSGKDGADGQDGVTPTIGDNGNWYLGDTDTGKPSRGEAGPAGQDGAQGPKGDTGADGKSAYQYAQEGGYTGTETEFAEKMAQEKFANPNALTFTGSVSATYDGSAPVSVEIPSGGGSSGGGIAEEILMEITLTEDVSDISEPITETIKTKILSCKQIRFEAHLTRPTADEGNDCGKLTAGLYHKTWYMGHFANSVKCLPSNSIAYIGFQDLVAISDKSNYVSPQLQCVSGQNVTSVSSATFFDWRSVVAFLSTESTLRIIGTIPIGSRSTFRLIGRY